MNTEAMDDLIQDALTLINHREIYLQSIIEAPQQTSDESFWNDLVSIRRQN
jgi:hypothetical protein